MKKLNSIFIVFVVLVTVITIYATSLHQAESYALLSNPTTWLVIISAIFLGFSFVAVFKAMDTMRMMILKKEGKLPEEEEEEEEQESMFASFWQKIQDIRPIEEEADIELDHNYDGIRELDNNLPPWWLWGFYISIAIAVIYMVRYHVIQTAPLSIEEYTISMNEAEKAKAEYLKNAANLVDESTVVMLTDASLLSEGGKIYKTNCAVCHAPDGGGTVGPNLTDPYWLHGGSIKDIFSTIKYGVPAKGMIPWKDQMGAADMQKVASFVLSLQGTTPANPKEAQGDLYQEKAEENIETQELPDSTTTTEVQE
jgi:cytochrome c oxidase cbb3-type subunit 3